MVISFASSSTCKCRLRLPSVSAHSCFRSPNSSPLAWVTSEVSTLRRARSWMTRSSPSYAKRGPVVFLLPRLFKCFPISELKYGGDQQLAHTEWNTHHPGRQGPGSAGGDQAKQPSRQIPHADGKHLPRKESARGEYAQAEDELPQT